MLRPRIIPCLLVRDKGLVKTVGFADSKYVGDPLNAVKIFNEKEVDELIVLDIDATVQSREPDYEMIANLAAECRMPLCYGGGIKTEKQARRIFGLGVEKVAVSSLAVEDPEFVSRVAATVGSQSVVAVLDVKSKAGSGWEVWTRNARINTGKDPVDLARRLEALGAGEIVLNSIDNDGRMKGYDLAMVDAVREAVDLPITVLGGAGSLADISRLIARHGILGAAAGSLFVFKGVYRAVLISYPSRTERTRLIAEGLARFHAPTAQR